MPITGKSWDYIADPIAHVKETAGLQNQEKGVEKEMKAVAKLDKELSKVKSAEITRAEPDGLAQWSNYNGQSKDKGENKI
jgi:Mn-containing catalase